MSNGSTVRSLSRLVDGEVREVSVSGSRRAKVFSALLGTIAAAGATFWIWITIDLLPFAPRTIIPRPLIVESQVQLATPGYAPVSELAAYRDELFAYLMFDYLRHSRGLGGSELLLTFVGGLDRPYRLIVRGQDDFASAIGEMAAVGADTSNWSLWPTSRIHESEQQCRLFDSAYNLPVKQRLEELPAEKLSAYMRRFIRFKSTTDPRIRRRIEPVPSALTSDDAQRLAGDIITVANFFSLPLDYFMGIGAMENNYMNVRGDLNHSIWRRRPAPDDIILERRRGRVRILNDSAGVWQITRETLRYAHKLVRHDTRDYGSLPEHLRPPKELRMESVSPEVLTTYAGVLLRDLLDHFNGDATLAASAYNGGRLRPNLRYGLGVERAAAHVRRVLEQSAAMNADSALNLTWWRAQ